MNETARESASKFIGKFGIPMIVFDYPMTYM